MGESENLPKTMSVVHSTLTTHDKILVISRHDGMSSVDCFGGNFVWVDTKQLPVFQTFTGCHARIVKEFEATHRFVEVVKGQMGWNFCGQEGSSKSLCKNFCVNSPTPAT